MYKLLVPTPDYQIQVHVEQSLRLLGATNQVEDGAASDITLRNRGSEIDTKSRWDGEVKKHKESENDRRAPKAHRLRGLRTRRQSHYPDLAEHLHESHHDPVL